MTTPDADGRDAHDTRAGIDAIAALAGYRGDLALTMRDGSTIEGFVFDLRGDADGAMVHLLPSDGGARRAIAGREVISVAPSGRDPASGRSWEAWIRRYAERKLAGEAASIESEPLD
jgi:hypothetical protein